MIVHRADNLDDLIRSVCKDLLSSNSQVVATRGSSVEQIGCTLVLNNPLARASSSESRGRLISAIGELLWYLSGDNRLDFISYYIPMYKKEDDGQGAVYGGYGPRMLSSDGGNQIENIISLLKERPSSRRAVIQIFRAEDIKLGVERKDVPCTCSMQFLIREGNLFLITYLRSNDAHKGLLHDVFCFTMLQEIVAKALGLNLGTYTHVVGSMHLYVDDIGAARSYIEEGWQPTNFAMPPMCNVDQRPAIPKVLAAEKELRTEGQLRSQIEDLEPFWRDIVKVLEVFSAIKHKDLAKRDSLLTEFQLPWFRDMMTTKVQNELHR